MIGAGILLLLCVVGAAVALALKPPPDDELEGTATCRDLPGDPELQDASALRIDPASVDLVAARLTVDDEWIVAELELREPPPETAPDEGVLDYALNLYEEDELLYSVFYGIGLSEDYQPRGFEYGDRAEPIEGFDGATQGSPMRGRIDASIDGNTVTVAVTRATVPQVGAGLRWSIGTSYIASGSGFAHDGCPASGADESGEVRSAVFPGNSASEDAQDAPEPAAPSTATSTEAPTTTSSMLLPARLSESQAAELILEAWNDGDREAAFAVASPEAVAQLFEIESPGDADLQQCHHWADVSPGEYPADATFYCDGSFDDGRSTVTLYVDGGASAGYSVSRVGLFGNPPGFTPTD